MMSAIYGTSTHWCSTTKYGFNDLSSTHTFLFRFLFKNGTKLRLTYDVCKNIMNWSDSSGLHFLKEIKDPFNFQTDDLSDSDMRISNIIETIPIECKNAVYEFIKKYNKGYNKYIIKRNEYRRGQNTNLTKEIEDIIKKYNDEIDSINRNYLLYKQYINIEYSSTKRIAKISYDLPNSETKTEIFKNAKNFEKRLNEIIQEMNQNVKKLNDK